MAILDDVKTSLRISHNKLDGEIAEVINACKLDLGIAGVANVTDTDALTMQAIKMYARGWFNYQGNAERYNMAYVALKQSMALCGDYNEVSADG